jgi:hypothetical protein
VVPNGAPLEHWDDVPAVADGLQPAQAAIAGRLLQFIKDDAHHRGVERRPGPVGVVMSGVAMMRRADCRSLATRS